ncbi:uncharacterized protein [Montipora foliosa]|uniref:uncharacterized protein n=1 Tax=Montipora foliosa TaxID=591990 RepID=UPI0035F19B43
MDIQFVLDPYACAVYILSYITKGQRGMSKLLEKASQEANAENKDVLNKVRHIGNKFLNAVEISAQEAVYLVLQMPLRKSSRQFQFINTSNPDERTFLLKTLDKIKEMPDKSTDVESDNVIKRYQRRPRGLDNVCLADFVACFNCVKDSTQFSQVASQSEIPSVSYLPETDFADNVDDDPPCEENNENDASMEFPMRGGFKLVKRRNPRIIRSVRFIAPNAQHVNEQDIAAKTKPSETLGCFDPDTSKQHSQYDLYDDMGILPRSNDDEQLMQNRLQDNEFRQLVRSLNTKQKEFFYHVLHSIKTKDDPLYLFLSGGAGLGKSTVTNALYEALVRYLNTMPGENPDEVKVLKVAPTGKAAFNIKGNTLHSAFKIPANRGFQYCALDNDRLNTIRAELGKLKIIFIDEISMVGSGMFNFLNLRLQQIMKSQNAFGGVSIIAVEICSS